MFVIHATTHRVNWSAEPHSNCRAGGSPPSKPVDREAAPWPRGGAAWTSRPALSARKTRHAAHSPAPAAPALPRPPANRIKDWGEKGDGTDERDLPFSNFLFPSSFAAGCDVSTPPPRWRASPRPAAWPTWPAPCRAPWPGAAIDCAVVLPLYRGVRTGQAPLDADRAHASACPSATAPSPAGSGSRPCPAPTCPSTSSSSPTTSSATTRPRAAASTSTPLPDGQQARLPRQLRALRLLRPGRPRGDPPARLLARRPARQRLADRPGPGLPATSCTAAAGRGVRATAASARCCTIHNIAYQGAVLALGHAADRAATGGCSTTDQLEFYGQLNFLKAGHRLRRPAEHRQPDLRPRDPDAGLRLRAGGRAARSARDRLCGIVNGVDYQRLEPGDRPAPGGHATTPTTVAEGKAACKADLQRRFGLPERARRPAAGHGRPAGRAEGLRPGRPRSPTTCCDGDVQLVVLGEGDRDVPRACCSDLRDALPGAGRPDARRSTRRWRTRSRRGPTSS